MLDAYLSHEEKESVSVYDSPKAFKDYSFHKEQYYQIDRQMLVPGTEAHFDIYAMQNYSYSLQLHATPEHPAVIGESLLDVRGDLMILKSDISKYNEYLNSILRSDSIVGKCYVGVFFFFGI